MDEVKKICSKDETIQVIENFNKNKSRKDGLNSICKLCRKKYYNEGLVKIKKDNEQNKERRNKYLKNKREIDVTFRIISNTRNRIYKSLKGMTKQSSAKDILGIDIDLFELVEYWNWSRQSNLFIWYIQRWRIKRSVLLEKNSTFIKTRSSTKKYQF